jgi:hypothetical protein
MARDLYIGRALEADKVPHQVRRLSFAAMKDAAPGKRNAFGQIATDQEHLLVLFSERRGVLQ